MTAQEVLEILVAEGFAYVDSWASEHHRLQTIIGEDHLYDKKHGSGYSIEYDDKDVRRAVAHLRINKVLGVSVGAGTSQIRESIKTVAMEHGDGSVIYDGSRATWIWGPELIDIIQTLLIEGKGFVVVPCSIKSLMNYATITEQTGDK